MIDFEIVQHIGTLSSQRELNLVSWNGQPAKMDLRAWRTDEDGNRSPNKGITLTEDEATELARLILARQ